jgi:O-antigen ligase
MALPFLMPGIARRYALYRFKWVLLALVIVLLVTSGGRAGTLAAVFVALLYAQLQPTMVRKIRTFLLIGMLAIVVVAILLEMAPQSAYTFKRLEQLTGQTGTEPVRVLLLRKAWHLALENPVVGIGFGNFRGAYHPVIEEATTRNQYIVALTYQAHNTYAEVLAGTGFPGLILFLGILGAVATPSFRKRSNPDIRLGFCMLGGVLFQYLFVSALGVSVYYPLTFLLGALLEQHIVSRREQVTHARLP